MFPRIHILAPALLALLIQGCADGQDATPSHQALRMPAPSEAAVAASLCAAAAGDTPGGGAQAYQRVDGQCLPSANLLPGADAAKVTPVTPVTPRALQGATVLDVTSLFDWAEQQYPSLFNSHQSNLSQAPYVYRCYSSGNCVGVADDKVYGLGPFTNGALTFIGNLGDFTCRVWPSQCAVPGAPASLVATAGDTRASIAFSTPASSGGSPITSYTASCSATGQATRTASASSSPITVGSLSNGASYSCTVSASNAYGAGAASSGVSVTPAATVLTGTSSTAGVQCTYSYSGFNSTASVNATSTASWSCGSSTRTLSANGLPDHATGTFPNANNPNRITAQSVSASYTLTPSVVSSSGTATQIVGYLLNGVKMDPNTAGTCDSSGASCSMVGGSGGWNIEALGQKAFNFGADSNNAHVQPNGEYHYHGMPEGFIAKQNKGTAMTLVGWASDGFPVYARYGYSVASDAASAIKVLKSSYQIKATPDTGRPSTTTYAMGTFQQDYQYVAGSGDLDECNGRTGVTPEFPQGIYHYVTTDTYPYIQRCVKGRAATATTPGGPPPPRP